MSGDRAPEGTEPVDADPGPSTAPVSHRRYALALAERAAELAGSDRLTDADIRRLRDDVDALAEWVGR